jgi:predicted dinucleotide-binding enzyme
LTCPADVHTIAAPDARVVKTLNLVNCDVQVNPQVTGDSPSMFVSGNSVEAKGEVEAILREFGWEDIIDLGDITAARGMEMLLPIWLSIRAVTKDAHFGFKVVRTGNT